MESASIGDGAAAARQAFFKGLPADEDSDALRSSFVLALWASCVLVSVLGHLLPGVRFKTPVPEQPAIQAELLEVQLDANAPAFPSAPAFAPLEPAAPTVSPPISPKPISIPATPSLVKLASPAAAFVFPVEAPSAATMTEVLKTQEESADRPQPETPAPSTAVVSKESDQASRAAAAGIQAETARSPIRPAVQTLTFGSGEGRQAAPAYPPAAVRAGQEGSVRIRFEVDESGWVRNAVVSEPSPWPLLNDSALRTVGARWRFSPGAKRLYEVPIHFRLKNK